MAPIAPDVLKNNSGFADKLRRLKTGLIPKARGWSGIFDSLAKAENTALDRFEATPVGNPCRFPITGGTFNAILAFRAILVSSSIRLKAALKSLLKMKFFCLISKCTHIFHSSATAYLSVCSTCAWGYRRGHTIIADTAACPCQGSMLCA